MATKHPDEQAALLCPICKNLLKEPRTGRCGHNYCEECLETILKELLRGTVKEELPGGATQGILFHCPHADCENPQYLIPSASIEDFHLNLNLKQKVEDVKIQEAEAFCEKHNKRCKLFCKESTCLREICWKCLNDHQKHAVIDKDDACSEYIVRYRDISEKICEELKGIEGSKKELSALIDDEENKMAGCVAKLFDVFIAAEMTMANDQIECITKALQELEFKAPTRTHLELENRAAPLRYIQRIGRPVLDEPGKNVKEPVIVFQAAEFALTILKTKKKEEQLQMKMKASVEDFAHLKHGFLSQLSEDYHIGVHI